MAEAFYGRQISSFMRCCYLYYLQGILHGDIIMDLNQRDSHHDEQSSLTWSPQTLLHKVFPYFNCLSITFCA